MHIVGSQMNKRIHIIIGNFSFLSAKDVALLKVVPSQGAVWVKAYASPGFCFYHFFQHNEDHFLFCSACFFVNLALIK